MYKSYRTKTQGPRALCNPSLVSLLGWGMMHSAVGILLLLHIEFLRGLKQTDSSHYHTRLKGVLWWGSPWRG